MFLIILICVQFLQTVFIMFSSTFLLLVSYWVWPTGRISCIENYTSSFENFRKIRKDISWDLMIVIWKDGIFVRTKILIWKKEYLITLENWDIGVDVLMKVSSIKILVLKIHE